MKTKTITLSLLLMGLMLTASCAHQVDKQQRLPSTSSTTVMKRTKVDYVEANHYFVRNDMKSLPPTTITTQQQFDSCFGMAAVMGKDGLPTSINFAHQFVIAVALPETDVQTVLTPVSLEQTNARELTFTYRLKRGQKQTYTMQPLLLIIVDKKYEGNVVLKAKESDK